MRTLVSTRRRVAGALLVLAFLLPGCQAQSPPQAGSPEELSSTSEEKLAMANTQDLQEILQLVLDHQDLQQYYHVDELPERKPVRIAAGMSLASEPKLAKFDAPVVYQTRDELEQAGLPYFEFTQIVLNQDLALVVFDYGVEGLRGRGFLSRGDSGWQVEGLALKERE